MKLDNHVWISQNGSPVMGNGRYQLLLQIKEFGSLTKAAKAMAISYKKAWKLVDSMNQNAVEPLVDLSRGGKTGGGAKITPYGDELIHKFELALNLNQELLFKINQELFEND